MKEQSIETGVESRNPEEQEEVGSGHIQQFAQRLFVEEVTRQSRASSTCSGFMCP